MPDSGAHGLGGIPPLTPRDAAAHEAGLALRARAEARDDGWVEAAVEAALHADHPFPRGEARIALQCAPAPDVVAALLGPLTSEHRRLRRRAMTLLPRLDAAEVVRQMRAWLPGASRPGKRAACVVLAALGDPGADLLATLSRDADPAVARRAVRGWRCSRSGAAAPRRPLRRPPTSPPGTRRAARTCGPSACVRRRTGRRRGPAPSPSPPSTSPTASTWAC